MVYVETFKDGKEKTVGIMVNNDESHPLESVLISMVGHRKTSAACEQGFDNHEQQDPDQRKEHGLLWQWSEDGR